MRLFSKVLRLRNDKGWHLKRLPGTWNAIDYANVSSSTTATGFVIVGNNGKVTTSYDGLDWVKPWTVKDLQNTDFTSIKSSANVAVSGYLSYLIGARNGVFATQYERSLLNYTKDEGLGYNLKFNRNIPIRSIACNSTDFVAVGGDNTCVYVSQTIPSKGTITWNTVTSSGLSNPGFVGNIGTSNYFYAGGESGKTSLTTNKGKTWESTSISDMGNVYFHSGCNSYSHYYFMFGYATSGGQYTYMAYNQTDNIYMFLNSWSSRGYIVPYRLNKVIPIGNKTGVLIGCGVGGKLAVSKNGGSSWKTIQSEYNLEWKDIACSTRGDSDSSYTNRIVLIANDYICTKRLSELLDEDYNAS